MDNLAHSLTGAIVGSALLPQQAVANKRRLFLTSIILANLPDIDILLALLGKKIYVFHHRGFTHSILGLLVMIPLGVWIFQKIMPKTPSLSRLDKAFFVIVQLLFSHYFLDYLTTYGTLFLYPFSWHRFSFPLMFIVDPLFWLTTGLGLTMIARQKLSSHRQVLKSAWLSLLAIFSLWGGELFFKLRAEAHYKANAQAQASEPKEAVAITETSDSKIYSYPGPFAPLFWLLVDKQTTVAGDTYFRQGMVSFYPNGKAYKSWQGELPQPYSQDRFCTGENYDPQAKKAFTTFQDWGEQTACSPFTWKGKAGCRCLSLKYSVLAWGVSSFGIYWISQDGQETEFLLPDPWEKLSGYYSQFIPGLGQGQLEAQGN